VNWDAIAAVGTLVGGVAVLLTLVYLSIQVRQNSRAVQLSGLADITAQWHHCGQLLASSPDLAGIVARGHASYDSLTTEEVLRYGAYVQAFFDVSESYLRLIEEIDLGGQEEVLASIVQARIGIPGMAEWWKRNVGDYDPGFVDWVEGIQGRA
jgi:hypothetical protein